MSEVLIPADALTCYAAGLLQAAGAPAAHAGLVAHSLVAANLRGVDSHGVQLLTFYLEQMRDGRIDPCARGEVQSESGATLIYDGGNGFGQVVADAACRHAVRLGREHGAGIVSVRESNHFGAAAYWAQTISGQGFLAIAMCNASPSVAPWQGKDPRWGTNPICMSLPGPNQGGWLLDMATTTVAMGKIYKAGLSGWPEIPPGWAMDSEGTATTSTAAALSGLLMPLGGYKGSGLAMMVEILCGVLSGGAIASELGGLRVKTRPFRVSHFFLALDVGRFMAPAEFFARVERLVAMAKSSAPATGYDEVLVAGEPEWRIEAVRSREGVPLTDGVWDALARHAAGLGVAVPADLRR